MYFSHKPSLSNYNSYFTGLEETSVLFQFYSTISIFCSMDFSLLGITEHKQILVVKFSYMESNS